MVTLLEVYAVGGSSGGDAKRCAELCPFGGGGGDGVAAVNAGVDGGEVAEVVVDGAALASELMGVVAFRPFADRRWRLAEAAAGGYGGDGFREDGSPPGMRNALTGVGEGIRVSVCAKCDTAGASWSIWCHIGVLFQVEPFGDGEVVGGLGDVDGEVRGDDADAVDVGEHVAA
ncbi:hypothetical protein [Streptosporangium canum]|uniref:hypothetical protein n=1 Tax=Streptosporangium canum TaxID=324952 RepID=UPI0033AD0EEA